MSDSIHIDALLQDYLDDALSPTERQTVEAHLATCATCRAEHEALAALIADVAALPRSLPPPRDLWPGIKARLSDPPLQDPPARLTHRTNHRPGRPPDARARPLARVSIRLAAAFIAILLMVGGAFWLMPYLLPQAWEIARLDGTPRIGTAPLDDTGRLHRGDWLETDDRSRAALTVGAIGNVEVEPNTRLQLVRARPNDHRLALETGTIQARIWAPPRLFFVETPSALAIDLGCAYTLHVDSTGGSLLHVTSGYVALQYGTRTSVVPAGSMCVTRPGHGPGTPFDEDASEAFRHALSQFDFNDGEDDALTPLLSEARPEDTATLWRLMYTVAPENRGRLYDRLTVLTSPPENVTRDQVLRADLDAVEAWDRHLGLDLDSGWFLRFFKKNKKKTAPLPAAR